MIASRLHKFIYIKTMKTASTSIELALSPHCGPRDILVPIGARFDMLRAEQGVYPRNFAEATIEKRYLKELRKRNPKRMKKVLREIEASGFWAHARPDVIMTKVGNLWNAALRFTSERHPYEKALSRAYFSYRGASGSFDAHLEKIVFEDRLYVGYPMYMVAGKVVVHEFLLHDTLQADFDRVTAKLGLPPNPLPRARHVERPRRPALEVLTSSQREFIYQQCCPEFELFGWKR